MTSPSAVSSSRDGDGDADAAADAVEGMWGNHVVPLRALAIAEPVWPAIGLLLFSTPRMAVELLGKWRFDPDLSRVTQFTRGSVVGRTFFSISWSHA